MPPPIDWLGAVGQTFLIAALSFVALTLLASHLRYQHLARRAAGTRAHGPAARTAFELHIAQRLGSAHRDPAPFVVGRVAPDGVVRLRELHGAEAVEELIQRIEERIRGLVRTDDLTLRLLEDEVGVLLRTARAPGSEVARRIIGEFAAAPVVLKSGLSIRVDLLAGLAAYPEDGDRAPDLYAKAEAALERARAAGRGWQWPDANVAPDTPAPRAHMGDPGEAAPMLDDLTGVLKAERLGGVLQKFVAARRRDDLPVSVLLLDVDVLRRYNQQYGREMGDALLKGLAGFLQKQTRERDIIARWGEDQFLVALDCAPRAALAVAQRLWNTIRKSSFGRAGLRATVTIGVSGWPDHSGSARGLFEEAQLALRVGKSKGRNQCVLYDPEMRKLKIADAPADIF